MTITMSNDHPGTTSKEPTFQPARPPIVVLLVDDRPFVAEALQRLLDGEPDIGLHYCHDPFLALEAAERVNPTVILVDMVMPEVDGLTLCRFFRAHPLTRDKPVIMLSSSEDSPLKADAFKAGANDYLVKLPDKVELVARLRYHAKAYIDRKERNRARLALCSYEAKMDEFHGDLAKLLRRDRLTGLVSRHAFGELSHTLWSLCDRNGTPISVIVADLDYFKRFNECYGHHKGDECLSTVATVCQQAVRRPADVLARLGGKQFAALLPATNLDGAVHVAENMRGGVEGLGIPHDTSKTCGYVSISLGVASAFQVRGAKFEALLKLAEECLAHAKALGRNQTQSALFS